MVAVGPPHMIAVYGFYIGRVDYGVDEVPRDYHLRAGDGTIREHVTGSVILTSIEQLRRALEQARGGVWLLGDRAMFETDDEVMSPPMKAYLKRLTRQLAYVGLDGKTFVVKVR